ETFHRVVVVDDMAQGREPAIVIEPALLMRPEPLERRRPVVPIGRSISLDVVDPELLAPVHVPAGLGEERRDVARRALRLGVEEHLAACRRAPVEGGATSAAPWPARRPSRPPGPRPPGSAPRCPRAPRPPRSPSSLPGASPPGRPPRPRPRPRPPPRPPDQEPEPRSPRCQPCSVLRSDWIRAALARARRRLLP